MERMNRMTNLLVLKERIVSLYTRFELYIVPVLKFLTMLLTMLLINSNIGFNNKLKNPAIVLIIALLCSFLPVNVMILISAMVILLHIYSLSLECTAIVAMIFLIMFVLYFRFSPKDGVAVILTPICFAFHIPYVVPLSVGFLGNPLSCISVVCGTITYYILEYVKDNSEKMTTSKGAESALSSFKFIIDGIIKNDTMVLMVVVFAIMVLVVYMIRRLSIDYAWYIALGVGTVAGLFMILVGGISLDADISIIGVILGMIISALIVLVLQFFVFNVDYSRTELVQFEDDEYYYYVKAIPKISVEVPKVQVKRINSQRRSVGK